MVPIVDKDKVLTPLIFENINVKIEGVKVIYSDTQIYIYIDGNKVANKSKIHFVDTLRTNLSENQKLYNIYTKGNYPQHWHFNSDLAAIPDIIVEAKPPARFVWKNKFTTVHGSTHGFDPKNNTSLQGVFIAAGPNIKQSRPLKPFENIHIFPLMNKVLGLNENIKIDGQYSVLQSILK